MKYLPLLLILVLFCFPCFAETIHTARGDIIVNKGDTLLGNSMWVGTIENLEDVTFTKWNFSRKIPHTEVFVNCTKLKFIDCNLNNVEIPDDFITTGSLTIHQEIKMVSLEKHKIIECADNKIRTYKITDEEIDVVERDFGDFEKEDKDKIKANFEKDGKPVMVCNYKEELINVEDTPIDKKYRHIRN